MSDISVTTMATHYCFIPTRSALSIAESVPLNGTLSCGQGTANRCTMNTLSTPLPAAYGFSASEINQDHVYLDARIGDVIVDEVNGANLVLGGLLPNTLNTYYNVGLPVQAGIPTITILVDQTGSGKLSINNTGKVGYATGDQPVASLNLLKAYTKCNAVVTVENGATLVVGADDISRHAELLVSQGSIVHIKAGGKLHITSDQSLLWIKPGAKLKLDAGAIVYLESPESNIRIEGELIWNGNIVFSNIGTLSKGFFDFKQSHTLTLGDNVDAFRLHGSLKTQRFIRIAANATLAIPAGRGIDLQQGAVDLYGEIVLGAGGFANFRLNSFYGNNGGNIGIQGDGVANFTMFRCTFDGINAPIQLFGAASQWSNLTQIRSTTFQHYTLSAVEIHDRGSVLYENCQFKGADALGSGVISKFNLVTTLRNCTLQDHYSAPFGPPPYVPFEGLQASVIVDGDWVFWMDGGEIRDGNVGILNSDANDAAPTNVLMSNQATIRDCYAGVAMRGNATTGQVIMDCARLIGNRYGIYGEDAGLVISPLLLTEQDGEFHNPNVFIRSSSNSNSAEYIHVCYITKPPVMPLPAQGNYWGINSFKENAPNNYIWLLRANCADDFLADVEPVVEREPMDCLFVDDELTGPNPNDCTIATLVAPNVTVRDKYRTGMEEIRLEQFDVAQNTFNDLSAQWQPNMPNLNLSCRTFLQSSRSLATGQGFNPPGGQDRSRLQATVSNLLLLSPNPTTGLVQVQQLDGASAGLRVWDAFGRLVLNTSGSDSFDTASWLPGLYLVESLTADGRRASARLVVQHK